MNIFYLDDNLQKCAEYHTDKHVIKMILESTQLLCSTYFFSGQDDLSPYKLTHKNHPCSIWTRESLSNWIWLRDLALELCKEYTYRYGKTHKCEGIIRNMINPNIDDYGRTPFKLAMDKQYIIHNNPVENYRNYYKQGKQHLFSWKKRDVPEWLFS